MVFRTWTLLALSFFLVAAEKPANKTKTKKERRSHHAHDHGVASVDIVLEAKAAAIEFRAPAESLFGFEHKPVSAADKKTVETQTAKFQAEVASLVKFADALQCQPKVQSFETFVEEHAPGDGHNHDHDKVGGTHSEVHAKISVECAQNIVNTSIGFGFSAAFPRIKTVKVQLLSATAQVGKSITDDKGTISI